MKSQCLQVRLSTKHRCFPTVVLEKTLQSPSHGKKIKPVNLKEISPEYSSEGLMLKLRLQYFSRLMWRASSLEKTLMLGKTEGKTRKGVTEDEMVGWHHRLNGHELEPTLGDSERQGSLACCSPWGHKESDTTEQLDNDNNKSRYWWYVMYNKLTNYWIKYKRIKFWEFT